MKESNSAMIKLGTAVNIITAVMFTLFTAYQIFLLIHIDAQRNGRLTGIILYLFLTAASFFALVHKPGIKFARSVLLIAGLLLLFGIRLINVPVIFGNLDFANTPSVLRCAVYVFSQLGTIALAIYYLLLRHNKRINSKRIRMVLLMSFVIVLYVSVLIMEYVLILKYRVNIDLSVKYTMLSRLLYCFGFVGMAVSFMLPIKGYSPSVKRMNQVSDEDAFVFSAPIQIRTKKEIRCRTKMILCFQHRKKTNRIQIRTKREIRCRTKMILCFRHRKKTNRIQIRIKREIRCWMTPISCFQLQSTAVHVQRKANEKTDRKCEYETITSNRVNGSRFYQAAGNNPRLILCEP